MNKPVVEKWVAALRSGQYEQGRGALHEENRFCCLGVLCDLYIKEHENAHWLRGSGDPSVPAIKSCITGAGGWGTKMPPGLVMEWAELDGEFCIRLATRNDGGRKFADIADYIEARQREDEQAQAKKEDVNQCQ